MHRAFPQCLLLHCTATACKWPLSCLHLHLSIRSPFSAVKMAACMPLNFGLDSTSDRKYGAAAAYTSTSTDRTGRWMGMAMDLQASHLWLVRACTSMFVAIQSSTVLVVQVSKAEERKKPDATRSIFVSILRCCFVSVTFSW
ncbi:hypothetical protein V8C34DRAFT_278171 [Trichoderma compactum]